MPDAPKFVFAASKCYHKFVDICRRDIPLPLTGAMDDYQKVITYLVQRITSETSQVIMYEAIQRGDTMQTALLEVAAHVLHDDYERKGI